MIDYKINVLKNGGIFRHLHWDAGEPPDIVFDASKAIKSSLKGVFDYDPEIDFAKCELQPVLIKDGTDYPLGVFRAATVGERGGPFGRSLDIEAYDRCWLLDHVKTESLVHMNKGGKYINEIVKQLAAVGIVRYISDTCYGVLPSDREDWPAGSSRLTIINELLSEVGFEDIFFDADGVAVLREYRPPSAGGIARHYSASDVRRTAIAPDYSMESDLFSAPNVFILVCANADRQTTLTATAENNSPLSAKSIINRGIRIPQVTKVNQVYDQTALQTMANRLRDASLLSARELTVSVIPEGGHRMADTVSVDHPDIGGIYREQGWSLRLEPSALMELRLRKEVLK